MLTFTATASDAVSVGKPQDSGRPRRHLSDRGGERPVSLSLAGSSRPVAVGQTQRRVSFELGLVSAVCVYAAKCPRGLACTRQQVVGHL